MVARLLHTHPRAAGALRCKLGAWAAAAAWTWAVLWAAAGPAGAVGGHGHDEADLLYSTQLRFGADGAPVARVGLMTGQRQVTLRAASGVRVRLSGGGHAAVDLAGGEPVTIQVEDPEPGQARYRVVLEVVRSGSLNTGTDARTRWSDRGLSIEMIEIGGIVGFPGRILDNRRVLVAEAAFHTTREAADKRASELQEAHALERPPAVWTEPVRRPHGTLVATRGGAGTVLRQRDLLTFEAIDGGPVSIERVEYGRGYKHHGFATRRYHGQVVVTVDVDATLAVVNVVSSEQMLRGLVPAETFPTAPAAALDAQAITARGELLAKIGVRHLADPYLVCATQHCQVYSGRDRERDTTDAAVARTRGQMLFADGGDGPLVDSVYSASCGGHTEHNEYVWEGPSNPTLRGRPDTGGEADRGRPWPPEHTPGDAQVRTFLALPSKAFCGHTRFGRKSFRWTRRYPAGELDTLVNARHAIGEVVAIRVLERGVSGRVRRVQFSGSEGSVVVEGELRVRRLLGNLKSGLFVVDRTEDGTAWAFTGGGYGHGVGMCQYGAIGMAEDGHGAHEILEHYYNGARVRKVY